MSPLPVSQSSVGTCQLVLQDTRGAELSPASRDLVFHLLPAKPPPKRQWVLLVSIDIRDIDVVVETGELGTKRHEQSSIKHSPEALEWFCQLSRAAL